MSVLGYFDRRRNEVRMPKGPDASAIRWKGPVLTGETTLQLRRQMEAAQEGQRKGERYRRPEEYDPVLRAHCGMEEQ